MAKKRKNEETEFQPATFPTGAFKRQPMPGQSIVSLLAPLAADELPSLQRALIGPPSVDSEARRKYALECAMRLAAGNVSMSPFGVSGAPGTLPPEDVVKVAREIDRFLGGD